MSRSRARVTVDTRGMKIYMEKVNREVPLALLETSKSMVEAAQGLERYGSGAHLRSSIEPLEVKKTVRGYSSGVGSANWTAGWAEKGTGARRTGRGGKAAKARAAGSGNKGEKALHFLSKSLYSGFPGLVERLHAAMKP